MMINEFAELTGITPAPEAWERIEYVYMNCDEFQTKQDIAEFYKKHDMNGIEKKYHELLDEIRYKEEMKEFIADLAYFSTDYVNEIKNHLAKIAKDIFKDKTIRHLLHEYKVRSEKKQQELIREFEFAMWHESEVNYSDVLQGADAIKQTLNILLIDEWWHGQQEEKK